MKPLFLCGIALVLAAPLSAQDRTRSPHGSLDLACETCHRSDGWTPPKISRAFDHGREGFPLLGAHKTASCRSCHESLDFTGAATTCASCHQDVHRGELGADCTRCHTPRSFLDRSVMTRAHQTTRFPLEGGHLATDCTSCHRPTDQGRMQFVAVAAECWSCHQPQFVGAKNPDHVASGMPRDCGSCHNTVLWGRGRFNHDGTRFPLTGAHKATGCTECHASGRYQGTPLTCVECHQGDYDRSTAPNHRQVGFATDCATCHATQAWNAGFDHGKTAFPLTGGHKATTCQQCHADGVYRGKPTTCVSCHQADFNTTTNPPHGPAGFSTTCTTCHSTNRWTGAVFDHGASQFPLTGAHIATPCSDCHADGVYAGKPTTCLSCHQADYNTASNPPHGPAGFSTTCTACHTTITWTGATFNHGATQFPLTGAHTTTPCAACHVNGLYNGTPTTCVSCHQADYNQTTNPNHQASSFSTDCATCHTSTTWLGATFNHDGNFFPIYSGKHNNKWSTCSECHQVPTDYAQFTCLTCHEHNKTKMDADHRGRSGYAYVSTECLRCHPRGS